MSDTPSLSTLERAPERVLKLVNGVTSIPELWLSLEARGLTKEELAWAWSALQRGALPPVPLVNLGAEVQEARASLDAWDEPNLSIAERALRRLVPEVGRWLMQGLQPATGPESVLVIQTFMERLDLLSQGAAPAEAGPPERQREAVEVLAARGIHAEERARIQALLVKAKSQPTSAETAEAFRQTAIAREAAEAARQANLLELHLWWSDWAEVARRNITKKSWLQRLGLLKRPSGKPSSSDPTLTE